MRALCGICFLIFLIVPGTLSATVYNFGTVSFDVLAPADGAQLGVNVVGIQNFTGASALAPDFPILTGLTLNSLSLTVTTPGGAQIFDLGSLGPGAYSQSDAPKVASDVEINSLILSAVLSQTHFAVDGGLTETTSSDVVLYQLLPSAGTALQAGLDIGVIQLETASSIPEPATWGLLLAGLALVAGRLKA